MGYYPVMLDVTTAPVVVAGGGRIAQQKLEGLVAAHATVTVVAPYAVAYIQAQAQAGRIRWIGREVRPDDLQGARLVIAATDDASVNREVATWARKAAVLVNCVDDPAASDAFAVSQIRRGSLVVSISTEGKAPLLARLLRRYLERIFDASWAERVQAAHELRGIARLIQPRPERQRWLTVMTESVVHDGLEPQTLGRAKDD